MSSKHKVQFMNDIHALGRIESVRVYPEQTQPSKLTYSKNKLYESITEQTQRSKLSYTDSKNIIC